MENVAYLNTFHVTLIRVKTLDNDSPQSINVECKHTFIFDS